MVTFQKGLEALADPKNEPLKWLLGDALKSHAKIAEGSHFLLEALAAEPRAGALIAWNAYIHLFRESLTNLDEAVAKATQDAKPGKNDSEDKLRSLIAEVMAVVHLRKLGYSAFRAIAPGSASSADFEALLGSQKTIIEVKNLREPQDIVRTVAVKHWKELTLSRPQKYNFRIALRHAHRGQLSSAAQKRLCMVLDQIPDIKADVIDEVLDGGVKIRIEKLNDATTFSPPEAQMFEALKKGGRPNGIVILSAIKEEHLTIEVSEVQSLLLKAIRPIAGALDKFFGNTYTPDALNVIALRWEPPDFLYTPEMLSYVGEKVEGLFADFNLQLKPILFCDPEIPFDLLQRYR
jgi:hypothetical protein